MDALSIAVSPTDMMSNPDDPLNLQQEIEEIEKVSKARKRGHAHKIGHAGPPEAKKRQRRIYDDSDKTSSESSSGDEKRTSSSSDDDESQKSKKKICRAKIQNGGHDGEHRKNVAPEQSSSMSISSDYTRFNPTRRKPNNKVHLSDDMMNFVEEQFTNFVPETTLQETILDSAPVPDMDVLNVPVTDTFVESLIENRRKSQEKGAEKGLTNIHNRLLMTMGPLSQLWQTLESLKAQASTSDMGQIDDLDVHQLLDLVEKSICCVGQTHVAMNFHRRLGVMAKLTKDVKKGKQILKKHAPTLRQAGTKLFGEGFKKELKKLGKERREATDVLSALGPPTIKKRRVDNVQFNNTKRWNNNTNRNGLFGDGRNTGSYPRGGFSGHHGNNFNKPFQGGPSGYQQQNKFGGQSQFRKQSGPFRGKNRYVKIVKRTRVQSEHTHAYIRSTNSTQNESSKSKTSKAETGNNKCGTSGRKTEFFSVKLAKDHKRPDNIGNGSGLANRVVRNATSTARTHSDTHVSERAKHAKFRIPRTVKKKGSGVCSDQLPPIHQQYVSGTKKGWGEQTCNQSEKFEQLHPISTFQNGGSAHGKRSPTSGRLHVQARSKRRLSGCTNSKTGPKIFKVSVAGQNSTVPNHGVRARTCTPPLHKVTKTRDRVSSKVGDTSDNLFGRHPDYSRKSPKTTGRQGHSVVPVTDARFCYQLGEINSPTHSNYRISRV